MRVSNYFYNCSKEYIDSLNAYLYTEIIEIIKQVSKKDTQANINKELFWLFCNNGWSYDTKPIKLIIGNRKNSNIEKSLEKFEENNKRIQCLTTTTLGANWHSDFAKLIGTDIIQLEVQFGKVEAMFKDFCGFKIAFYERRISLGVEIVIQDPNIFFKHRKKEISGMANFKIGKKLLPTLSLNCPIWLIGIFNEDH